MKITILCVGKLKEKYLKDGVGEYLKRLSRFATMEIIEVEDEKAADSLSAKEEEQVKEKEAEKLQKRMKEGSYRIILDVGGQNLTSEEFSQKLRSVFLGGKSHIEFIIGGSLGYPDGFTKQADLRLSLSNMTYPHQLVRLILVEQIYRAFKIMNNETYHK